MKIIVLKKARLIIHFLIISLLIYGFVKSIYIGFNLDAYVEESLTTNSFIRIHDLNEGVICIGVSAILLTLCWLTLFRDYYKNTLLIHKLREENILLWYDSIAILKLRKVALEDIHSLNSEPYIEPYILRMINQITEEINNHLALFSQKLYLRNLKLNILETAVC